MTKLLLIRDSVKNYNDIVSSRSSGNSYIIINDRETSGSFREKLAEVESKGFDLNSLTHLGLVFDNRGNKAPYFEHTEAEIEEYETKLSTTTNEETEAISDIPFLKSAFIQSGKFFSPTLIQEIKYIKDNSSLEFIDLITCNVPVQKIKYEEDEFNDIGGITIRYSTNFTGKNGDWILESHNINIKNLYFNDSIAEYPYTLGIKAVPIDGNLYTAEQLYSLMLSTDTGDMARSYTVMNNIDMSGYQCESIGKSSANAFKGNFNGNGYTITINETATNNYFGFFSFIAKNINNVLISNIKLKYISSGISFTTTTAANYDFGGLCGELRDSTTESCSVEFSNDFTYSLNLNFSNTSFNVRFGGFIGRSVGSIINNCSLYSKGDLILSNEVDGVLFRGFVGGFLGFCGLSSVPTSIPSISNCNFICDKNLNITSDNNDITTTSNTTNAIGGFIGQCQNTTISNIKSLTKGDLSLSSTTGYMSISNGAAFGAVVSPSGAPNNFTGLNFQVQGDTTLNSNILSSTTADSINSGVFGNLTGSSSITHKLTSSVFNFRNYTINNTSSVSIISGILTGSINNFQVDGVEVNITENILISNSHINSNNNPLYSGGVGRIINNGIMNNCSISCGDFNIINQNKITTNPIAIGGLCGELSSNITNCNINVYNKFSNTNTNFGNPEYYFGGLIGRLSGNNTANGCVGVFGGMELIGVLTTSYKAIGGMCGQIYFNSPQFNNSCVFIGGEAKLSIDLAGSSFAGGVFGVMTDSSNATNCVMVYNEYTINGSTRNATIGSETSSNTPTNIASISYGGPIDGTGVQDVPGPGTQSTIIDIMDNSPYTLWCQYLLGLRQQIPGYSNTEYVNLITNATTDVPLFFRNAAINTSMVYANITDITVPFSDIKNSLKVYSSSLSDDTQIEYINPEYIGSGVYNYAFILSNNKKYYINQNTGVLRIDNKDLFFSVDTVFNTITLSNPDGSNSQTLLLNQTYNIIDGATEKRIKNIGIGSVLLETSTVEIPTPNNNSKIKKESNWPLITLLIVVIGTLIVLLILHFGFGFFRSSSGFGNLDISGTYSKTL